MSFVVAKHVKFSNTLKDVLQNENYETDLSLRGGILSNTRYIWQTKGPCLEVRDSKNGCKIGSWTFGCVLKDSNTKLICVKDLKKSNGGLYLLAVALECTISGGIICLFNVFSSTIIRAIHVKEKISSVHVVDPGVEVLNLPGPLRDFDGILAVGTEGGRVLLVDMCRQVCEQTSNSAALKDELNPAQLLLITPRKISRLEQYRERAIHEGDHLAIHLNVVFDSQTEHFTLKGPKGEHRIHVNKDEVVTSTLNYCPQLTSLLVGFNFGAFQLWDLTTLQLVYTSPICDEHIPVTNFAIQEPTDDPRAFCYVWVSYSYDSLFHTGLPFAVMYSFCYTSKEYHEGYGYLYQNFQSCSVRYQIELGPLDDNRSGHLAKGGYCLGLQPVYKVPSSKESHIYPTTGDTLALCFISWTVWYSDKEIQTYALVFDLNQWYKEQMPTFTKWSNCNSYILRMNFADFLPLSNFPALSVLDLKLDPTSLRQFIGIQRLEEHFYPTSLSFNVLLLKESDIVCIHCEGLQKSLLHQIQSAGPLCLVRPSETYHKVVSLGLTPLFLDIIGGISNLTDLDFQREVILDVALEYHLVSWLYTCARDWANGRFSSAGCSLDFLLNWAFQRAVVLKTNCDKLCASLFDYSQSKLDHNTSIRLTSCTGQINILCKVFYYVLNNLMEYISYINVALEQKDSLEMVAMYFEVLQWLVNVGLLPECHPSSYPRPDVSEKISAPYPAQQLTEYYIERRAQLQLLSKERFASSDSLLFIDNLINNKCGAELLQKQWQDDGGSGLYPPPSLQSLLRTYLVPGANICHKHSLVIYLFLDLAMALDQCQYSSIITYLIKFPAVFKVTPSIIKITQAFWQLDHGDYNTALEQLLDPFVLNDDLQPWHHTIAMRSLLLQNQHNAALVYMQVRKPPITEDGDIFTAISLFITNQMLAEAFYFLKHHCHNKEEKYLLHLFNECNKNKSLHILLYKCLNNSEEKAFLNYLSKVQNPTSKDLQVFYFLLRSRFVEAFEVHSNLRKKKPETQGLIGQKTATQTDQVVKIFKTLLPDINRNLVEYIQKERSTLWTEVPRPTPLSVFVHNTQEKVQYKSTIIGAAISKAKDTFSDTINRKRLNEVLTEETPFLRTPTAFRNIKRHITPVITPKVIELDENGEEVGPTPSKRLKLSPRVLMSSPTRKQSNSIHSKMLTPIVARKTSANEDNSISNILNICTPQSILKVRNLVRYSDSVPEDSLYEDDVHPKTSTRKSALGLLPRKSLSRSTQHVQFEDVAPLSSSVSDLSSRHNDNSAIDDRQKSLSSRDISLMVSSKNSSTSVDEEVFYSPETSANEIHENANKIDIAAESTDQVKECVEQETIYQKDIELEENKEKNTEIKNVVPSPRARRSYKSSFEGVSPIRSSPRLSRKLEKPLADTPKKENRDILEPDTFKKEENTEQELGLSETTSMSESPSSRSPRLLPHVKGRKSLSRKVLEHNTFSKLVGTIPSDLTVSKEIHLIQSEETMISEKSLDASKVTTVRSSLNISDISTTESDNKTTPVSNKKRVSSSSFSKTETLKSSIYLDSSTLSEYSYSCEPDKVIPEIIIPDSVIDYLNSLKSKGDNPIASEVGPEDETLAQNLIDVNSSKLLDINKEPLTPSEQTQCIEQSPYSDRECQQLSTSYEKENQEVKTDDNAILDVYSDLSNDAENAEDIQVLSQEKCDKLEENRLSTEVEMNNSDNFDVAFIVDSAEVSYVSSKVETPKINDRAYIMDKSEISDDILPSQDPDRSIIIISSEEENSSESDQSYQNEELSFDDGDDDDINTSQEHIYDSEESKSTVDLGNSRCSESSSDIQKLQEKEHVNKKCTDVLTQHNLVTEEIDVKFQSVDTELKLSEDKNKIVDNYIPEQLLDYQETVFIKRDDEIPVILPRKPAQQNQNLEDKTFAVLQTMPLEEETLNAVEGILHESPDYMEVIPPEDQELFEGTLVKEVSTTPDASNIEPPQLKQTKLVVEQDLPTIADYIEDQNPTTKHMEQLKDVLRNNVDDEISLKRDQSTNTTQRWTLIEQQLEETTNEDKEILSEKESTQESLRKDRSTNTTQNLTLTSENITTNDDENLTTGKFMPTTTDKIDVNTTSKSAKNTAFIEKEKKSIGIKDEKLIDTTPKVKKSEPQRVYSFRNKKISAADSNSSSSDITEGEVVKEEILVTAQVHTPSERKVEEPPVKKITRKLLQEPALQISVDSGEIKGSRLNETKKESVSIDLEISDLDHQLLPGKRTTRRSLSSSSAKATKKRPVRTRRASHSELNSNKTIDCDLDSSKQIIENPVVENLMRRTRSASVDEPKTYTRKHYLRRGSLDKDITIVENVDNKSTRSRSKAHSVSNLPVIDEELQSRKHSKTRSVVADYASSRRLTRKQASMLKEIPTPSEVTAIDESETDQPLEDDVFDPINLLDKEPFKGTPDPEEQKVYEETSPSTSTVSSFAIPTKRRTRSASVASDVSLSQSASQLSPKKNTGSVSPKEIASITKRIKTRSRTHSETSSVSKKSDSETPPKRSKRNQGDDNETSSVASVGSRTSRRSRNSAKSESPKSTKGSRRKLISKSELPEIQEEKITEVADSKGTEAKKRTRKR